MQVEQVVQVLAIALTFGVTIVALALAARAVQAMVRVVSLGQPVPPERTQDRGRRAGTTLREVGLHTRMLKLSIPGAAHWFVMIGFGALLGTLITAYGETIDPEFELPFLADFAPYNVFVELITMATLIGALLLTAVRQANLRRGAKGGLGLIGGRRSSRFYGSYAWRAYYVEATIISIAVLVLVLRGIHEARVEADYSASYFASWVVGRAFTGLSDTGLDIATYVAATLKVLVSMAWFIVIATNLTMGVAWHRFTAFPNIYFKRFPERTSLGGLQPMRSRGELVDFEDPGEDDLFGVGKVEDFTWKGLLDVTTCTECGRCQSQCPAWNTDKPLSPKLLIMDLRDHLYAKAPYLLGKATVPEGHHSAFGDVQDGERGYPRVIGTVPEQAERPLVGTLAEGGVIDPDVLWSCTTCGACVEQCPVDIEHVDHILDMRRYQVLIESAFPSEAGVMLRNLENTGNPWGANNKAREDWTDGLPFEVPRVEGEIPEGTEYLFWVGCAGALEDRSKKVTRAFAELLHTADVRFAILGSGEACTGDPARRMGNEFVFQMLAAQNVETLNDAGAGRPGMKIVATCPHCFNTLSNEYGQLGGNYEVVHHTQLLGQLVREGRLVPVTPIDEKVTYHDPCYLGRHNRIYTPPREVLAAIPGLFSQEMPRCKERGFCCGAGGARMWMEEKIGKRINVERTDEALGLDPDMVSTACPFCMVMLSDAVTAKQQRGEARDDVQVLDVSQILARSMVAPPETVAVPEPELVGAAVGGTTVSGAPVGGSSGSITPDVVTEAPKPVEADPDRTAVADYGQLAQQGSPALTPEGHGPNVGHGPQHSTGTPGDAPGGASEGGGSLSGQTRPQSAPASKDPDTAP